MLKKLLAIIGLDILLIGAWILNEQPGNDMAILGVVLPPVILGANLLVALLCLLLKKPDWRNVFLVNVAVAPLIFILLLNQWFSYSLARQYTDFTFNQAGKHYQLTIDKLDPGFNLLELDAYGSSGLLMGEYRVKNDTMYLLDAHQPKRCFVYHGRLYGFGGTPSPILLIPKK